VWATLAEPQAAAAAALLSHAAAALSGPQIRPGGCGGGGGGGGSKERLRAYLAAVTGSGLPPLSETERRCTSPAELWWVFGCSGQRTAGATAAAAVGAALGHEPENSQRTSAAEARWVGGLEPSGAINSVM
jgi:hypothetical protein